jgi:hypothetical protein
MELCYRTSVVLTLKNGARAMREEQGRIVESPVEARAGFLDRPVLLVLIISVALVCVLFGLVYGGFFGR